MKKSLMIIGIVIIIIVILFIGAWIWVDGLKKDTAVTKEKMNEILKAYPNFNQAVDDFSNLRNQFYKYKEDLYIETLVTNAAAWNTFIQTYENGIQKVEKAAKVLKKDCNVDYGDVNVSTKCTTFKANYEAAQNYYISDANLYNTMVDEYDKYNAMNENKYPIVNKAKFVVYKDYIDYDKDGECFGKEEVSTNEG